MKDYAYGTVPIRKFPDGYKILIVKHAAGHWTFPKGHPNPNEDPKDTAVRETLEETGLRLDKSKFEERFCTEYPIERNGEKIQKITCVYPIKIDTDETPRSQMPGEIIEVRWCNYDEAEKLLVFENLTDLAGVVFQFYGAD